MRGLTRNERLLLVSPPGSEIWLDEAERGTTILQLARDGRVVIYSRINDECGSPTQFGFIVTEIGRMAVRFDAIDNPIRT